MKFVQIVLVCLISLYSIVAIEVQSTENVIQISDNSLEERRVLFAERLGYGDSDEPHRMLGRRRRRGNIVKKTWKKVTKTVKGPLKKLSKGDFSFVKNAYGAVAKDLNLKGKFIPRSALNFADKNVFKKLVQGAGSMVNYFKNQFADDMKWFADKLAETWNFLCNTPGVYTAVVTPCSYLINAATCTVLGGIAPAAWCVPLKIWDTILQAVGAGIFRTIITCSVYYAFKDLMCAGRAHALGVHFASFLLADPFTIVCDVSFTCSCGKCPYTCNYHDAMVCDPDTYEDALEVFGEVVDSLL